MLKNRLRNRMRRSWKASWIWAGIVIVILNFPIYWTLNTSLKSPHSVRQFPPRFFPEELHLATYAQIFEQTDILLWLGNSLLLAAIVILLTLLVGIPGAYSLSRYHYRETRLIGLLMLVSQMLPATLLSIPLFIMFRGAGLTVSPPGKLLAVVLSHAAIVLPFVVWMLKGYFDTLPHEIEESVWLDGGGRLYSLLHIIVPLSLPGLAATGLYSFVLSWNDYIFSRIFLASSRSQWTISLGISSFKGEFITPWNQVMAVSLLSALPILFTMIFMQKYFISGLTAGSGK